ncbi:chaperone modulator CbpM [Anaerorudis cellulosivorans]|jgi:hypothetical protein|uniref:chaperone modulator CbpM n=1 Tax=Anaerorudis cellulosivorans TaxID=3397862 RepID=UPI00222035C3|nr:chaperone modulator CbpM [Seramator thermalis]MCW1735071.1 chaperone modulator CbpM [Seramator thermalis]
MSTNKLLYNECIRIYKVESAFIDSLNESGLIHIDYQDEDKYIDYEELPKLEQFMRWYYDMDINIEGIEALNYLLDKVKALQEEIMQLRNELRFYKSL